MRPGGLAHVFVAIFTLLRDGYAVTVTQALSPTVQSYMRRAHFWNILRECGARAPDSWIDGENGTNDALIECRMIRTSNDLKVLQRQNDELLDCFGRALKTIGIRSAGSSQLWSELCANAAEHSHSPHGAFVMAQCYDRRECPGREIEIAIADVGRGVFASLKHLDAYPDHRSAVAACLEWGVTGRQDAVGKPMDGGTGLFTARCDADRLMLRSGAAMARNVTGTRERTADAPLAMTTGDCYPLAGTIVTALVFASQTAWATPL